MSPEVPEDAGHTPSDPRARWRRGAVAIGGLLALAVVGVLRLQHHHTLQREADHRRADAPVVRVLTVGGAPPSVINRLPAQAAPWHVTTVYARVNGFVSAWTADIGDRVKPGQTLATIDTPELDAELAAARARLDAAKAQAELARTTDERWRDTPKGAVADQERDAKHAEHSAAEATVRLESARVSQYEVLSGFKRVTAPFEGTVSDRTIDIGTLVTTGNSTTTPLYRIVQDAPLRVYVSVPQAWVADLARGDGEADIYLPGSSDAPVTGRVARRSAALDAQTRSLRIEVDLPNTDHRILPGAALEAALHLAPRGAVAIPAQALRLSATGPEVLKVDAAGHVQVASVEIARDDGRSVEIRRGVTAGDRLIINPADALKTGDTVRVMDDATAPTTGHATP